MREFLGLWASDEGADCSIRKRAASCILPGKRRRDGLRALDADLVVLQIEVGQRGAEQIKPNRNAEKREKVVQLAGDK